MKTLLGFAKIISLAFMLACALTAFASAEIVSSGTARENINWTFDDSGKLTITGTGEIDLFSVPEWETIKEKVTSVEIGYGITNTGSDFQKCYNLVSVTLPESLTMIDHKAFYKCSSLEEITIPYGVTHIGAEAFKQCEKLKTITIPDSVVIYGEGAFYGCYALEEAILSANAPKLCRELFRSCRSLKKVVIPNGVTIIEPYAFSGCGFESLVCPETLVHITQNAFFFCENYSLTFYSRNITIEENISYASSIIGYAGSGAQKAAERRGVPFIPLEDPTVTLPEFKVTLGGFEFNNTYAKYPLIVYKNITYLPMTYFDSRLLGLETEYSAESGLAIKPLSGDVPEYQSEKLDTPNAKSYTASLANGKISVNGKRIYNHTEDYPLLLFRDVTYFPLTWRFAVEEFSWNYSFDTEDGLVVSKTS